MWQYQLDDAAFTKQEVTIENGNTYNLGETQRLIQEKHEFLRKRSKSMQWFVEPVKEVKASKKPVAKGKVPPKGTPVVAKKK